MSRDCSIRMRAALTIESQCQTRTQSHFITYSASYARIYPWTQFIIRRLSTMNYVFDPLRLISAFVIIKSFHWYIKRVLRTEWNCVHVFISLFYVVSTTNGEIIFLRSFNRCCDTFASLAWLPEDFFHSSSMKINLFSLAMEWSLTWIRRTQHCKKEWLKASMVVYLIRGNSWKFNLSSLVCVTSSACVASEKSRNSI